MSVIHFLNVLEGDCNIIQHDSGRTTVIDISNAYNDIDTEEEKRVRTSEARKLMLARTQVPSNKKDYGQKKLPDNPIQYLRKLQVSQIFRFVITHPDMDHLDGIKDLYDEFSIPNTWDSNNNKEIDVNSNFAGYNKDDWEFYCRIHTGKLSSTKRLTYYASDENSFFTEDFIKVLCPTPGLIKKANDSGDYNDASYVLLYSPPKSNGGRWKILFAGDSNDDSWEYILKNHQEDVANIDVLFAPHHGRDSGRNYEFLKTLNPTVTLFGNASSEHLAYNCYDPIRITNNQAGYVIIKILEHKIVFYVKNFEFARDYHSKRKWDAPKYYESLGAYDLFKIDA